MGSEEQSKQAHSLQTVLDELSFGAPLILSLFLCTLVMLIDGYDLAALPLALPYILQSWDGEAASFGPALSAVLLGLGAGALLLAPLGDRHGRRKLIIASLLAVALFTIGTGFSSSIGEFTFWRLMTGTALGACLPNVTALVAELAPKRRRAGIIVFVSCGVSLGAAGAGLVVPWLVSLGGWQMIFYMSGFVTLLIVLLLYLILPDSPGYLLRTGQYEILDRLLDRLGTSFRAAQLSNQFPDREKSGLATWLAPFEKKLPQSHTGLCRAVHRQLPNHVQPGQLAAHVAARRWFQPGYRRRDTPPSCRSAACWAAFCYPGCWTGNKP